MSMPVHGFASATSSRKTLLRHTSPPVSRLMVIAILFSGLALGLSVPLPCLAQAYSKKQLQDIYVKYLKYEGFLPEVTETGNVRFKREGRTYTIVISESDPTYFVLAIGFQADTRSPPDRLRHLEAVNEATATTKVAKAYLDSDGDLTFTVETVQPTPEEATKGIPRMFRILDLAMQKVIAKLQK